MYLLTPSCPSRRSSDLVASQVDVYKSPPADMLESGLAETVNMQSIRPLAIGKRRVAMTLEGAYNEQARGSISQHISVLYTDTFLDNRLGWTPEERRGGQECVGPCRSGWWQYHSKKNH